MMTRPPGNPPPKDPPPTPPPPRREPPKPPPRPTGPKGPGNLSDRSLVLIFSALPVALGVVLAVAVAASGGGA